MEPEAAAPGDTFVTKGRVRLAEAVRHLVGVVSPLAPPVEYEYRDGRLFGRGVFHAAYEGPPGYVHGGWIALGFDEILGMANIASGHPGMTGRLSIRYRR